MSSVLVDRERRLGPGFDASGTILELDRNFGADRPAGGQTDVTHNDVSARLSHFGGVRGRKHIRRSQKVLASRRADHFDFEVIGHPGSFEVAPEDAVNQPDRREILHAGKAGRLHFVEKSVEDAEGIGAVDPCENGVFLTTGRISLAISITISLALP